jgi:hypothetical protein
MPLDDTIDGLNENMLSADPEASALVVEPEPTPEEIEAARLAAEEVRLAAEVEEKRLADEVEATRLVEEARLAEETRIAEEARLAEEARQERIWVQTPRAVELLDYLRSVPMQAAAVQSLLSGMEPEAITAAEKQVEEDHVKSNAKLADAGFAVGQSLHAVREVAAASRSASTTKRRGSR